MRALSVIGAIVALAVSAGAAWVVLEYRQFRGDIHRSEERVPRSVEDTLAPSRDLLEEPTVTLVRGGGQHVSGGALLVRTDPDQRLISFLAIPGSVRVGNGATIRDLDVPELVDVFADAGIDVAHVGLVSLLDIGPVVDAIGGITVRNARPFDYSPSPSVRWHYPAGGIHLDGRHAVGYLAALSDTEPPPGHEAAEQKVLQAVVTQSLRPDSLSQLQDTARAFGGAVGTDLGASDMLGLVWVRLRATRLVQCAVGRAGSLSGDASRDALRTTDPAVAGGPQVACRAAELSPPATLPPKLAVKVVSRHGLEIAIVTLIAALVMLVVATWAFARRRPVVAGEAVAAAGPVVGRRRRTLRERALDAVDDRRRRSRLRHSMRLRAGRTAARILAPYDALVERRRRRRQAGGRPPA